MRRWLLSAACGAALGVLGLPSIAAADTTLTVTGTGDPSTAGTCTGTTCTTLRAAMLAAPSEAAGGTVTIDLGSDLTYDLSQGTIIPGDDSNGVSGVVLDGNGSTIDLAGNGSGSGGFFDSRLQQASDPITFEDLTLADADLTSNALQDEGDVIFAQSVPLTLDQVAFSHDSVSDDDVRSGAGLSATGVTFTDDSGDGFLIDGGTNTLDATSFIDQTGGASIFIEAGGSTTLTDTSLSGGSGFISSGAPTTINGMSISGVTGASPLFLARSSTVDDLSVTGNQSDGPAVLTAGPVTGQNWTVADNTSSGGTSAPGGGIEAEGGTLKLSFATLDGNSDSGDADELYATGDSTIDIGDSIITGSSAGGAAQCAADPGSAIVSTGYNLDQAGGCGFHATGDLNGVNPLLGALATGTNGAFGSPLTLTYAPLEYGSPAVGVIPPADCSATTDELGDVRPEDPNGCAIGAYEPPTTAFTLTQSGAPATATPGTSVTYTLTATNASTTTPQHAVITDALPAGASLTYATVSVAGGSPVVCTGTTTISCPVGALPRGKQAVATITATLNSPGANVNAAYVSSEYPDVDDAKGTASASTQVSAPTETTTTPTPAQTTPTSTGPTTTSPSAATLVLSGLKLTPARFASRGKATLVFTASTAGSLTATVTRSEPGVKSGKSCLAPPKHAKAKTAKCTRIVTITRFTVAAKAGANTLALPTKVRDLAPGSYHLTIATKTLAFTVTKPAPGHRKHEVRS